MGVTEARSTVIRRPLDGAEPDEIGRLKHEPMSHGHGRVWERRRAAERLQISPRTDTRLDRCVPDPIAKHLGRPPTRPLERARWAIDRWQRPSARSGLVQHAQYRSGPISGVN